MKKIFIVLTTVMSLTQVVNAQKTNIFSDNGNVGIGTTTPSTKLEVVGGILGTAAGSVLNIASFRGINNNIGKFDFLHKRRTIGNNWQSVSSRIQFVTDISPQGYVEFNSRPSNSDGNTLGAVSFGTGEQEFMRINVNGNVGIGTENPKEKLHVKGLGWFTNDDVGGVVLNANDGAIELASTASELTYIDFKGKNNVNADYVGRILYKDGDGFSISSRVANILKLKESGNVGIGTSNPDERLTVKGKIHAEEIKVDLQIPADYVFQKYYTGNSTLKADYTLPTLAEVEKFTKENHHLPNIPSAKEIQEKGLHLGEMSNLLLQKIEELTLYTIEQEKRAVEQEKRIQVLEAKLTEQRKTN